MGSKATRDTIITTAARLFSTQGYENTSIQEVIDSVGVSKGAFYHYFNSKADILESIASAYVQQGLELTESILNDPAVSGLQKLNRVFVVLQQFKSRHKDTRAVVHRALDGDQNLKMEKLITRQLRARLVPLLASVLDEAHALGEHHIENTHEMAELLFVVMSHLKLLVRELALSGADRETAAARLSFYERAISSMLELPGGSLQIADAHLKLLFGGEA